jgi:hypothetical protein
VDISKYAALFHDGAIMDIQHQENNIEFSMYSAEIDEEDLQDDIPLSKDGSIQGRLHVEGVKNMTINDKPFFGVLKKTYQRGRIFDLQLKNNCLEMDIDWRNYPFKIGETYFTSIKIEAEKIWWETIPDLEDLYP